MNSNKLLHIFILLNFIFYLPFGEGWNGILFAQYTGGNSGGYALVSKIDIVACAALPVYSEISTGGNADGYALVFKTDIVACAALPVYSEISTGGNADGSFFSSSGCLAVLPIELLSFDVTLQKDKTVLCQWATATEINNDYYIIERSKGNDTLTFEQIGKVDGAGNSSQALYYAFYDEHPYTGLSYYRLKQVDFNGDYTYSNLRAINMNNFEIIKLSPNPAEKEINVLLYSNERTNIRTNIYNVLGQKVVTEKQMANKGTTNLLLNVEALSTGYYLLEVMTESSLYRVHKKLIKN